MQISAQEDRHSHAIPSWRDVHAWAEREMLACIERLRSTQTDATRTAELRGRCQALEELSRLPRALAVARERQALRAGEGDAVEPDGGVVLD